MFKGKYFALILTVSFILIIFTTWSRSRESSTRSYRDDTVIFNAFENESGPFIEKLKNKKDVSRDFKMCDKAIKGKLFDQDVTIVTTGTGATNASTCTLSFLEKTNGEVKEIIFSGIGGITPNLGGQVNSSGAKTKSEPSMLGDVCINSSVLGFDSQYYSSDTSNSLNTSPKYWEMDWSHSTTFIKGSEKLASELYLSALEAAFSEPPQEIAKINIFYHSLSRKPKTWQPDQCIEVSDNLFWHDSYSDQRAREIGSKWLNTSLGIKTTPQDILVITAMETAAVAATVEKWNQQKNIKIPFAYVRSASNFDQIPVDKYGKPKISPQENLARRSEASGVDFASENASKVILKMLERRN